MRKLTPSIRPYDDDDLDALMEIERASFPSAWTREMLLGFIQRDDSDCRVLEVEGRIVAFFLVLYVPDGLHMANLAVHPEFHRRGLALRALAVIDQLAGERGAERVSLEVLEANLAAQVRYRKAGYRAVKILSNYYGSQDGYRMVKRFGRG